MSLSLVMEVSNQEVEEELSAMATLAWSGWKDVEESTRRLGGSSSLKYKHEHRRGPAGAVTCETRDLGIK